MHQHTNNEGPGRDRPDATWSRVVHSTDVDDHAGAQTQWSLSYDQLSRGRFAGTLNLLQLPGVRLVHETTSCAVRQKGQIGEGHYGFAMTLDQPGEAIFNGQRLDRESIMMGRSEELDLSTPAGFSMIGIVVEGQLLSSLWERMYQKHLADWLEQQIVLQFNRAIGDPLRASHLEVLNRVAARPTLLQDHDAILQIRDSILIDWIEAIPARVDASGLRTVDARKRVVHRACELMLARRDQPMTILQLCSEIGASPSKLEYCFRDILGITPSKYLRALRLNGVRRDLKSGAANGLGVQDIATRWGFWHLGEFSADFKRQFGELPSVALRRARAEAA